MDTEKKDELTLDERQANIDRLVATWKSRKKLLEQRSTEQFTTSEYKTALAELDKRHVARGSRTVKV